MELRLLYEQAEVPSRQRFSEEEHDRRRCGQRGTEGKGFAAPAPRQDCLTKTEEARKGVNEKQDTYAVKDLLNHYYAYRGTVVVSGEAYLDNKKLLTGRLRPDDWDKVTLAASALSRSSSRIAASIHGRAQASSGFSVRYLPVPRYRRSRASAAMIMLHKVYLRSEQRGRKYPASGIPETGFAAARPRLVRLTGFEPTARSVGGCCSIQMSYRRKFAAVHQYRRNYYNTFSLIMQAFFLQLHILRCCRKYP